MKCWIITLLAMLTACLSAADLTTKSAETYKDCSIEGASTNGVVIFYELGGATVPYTELPDDLRAKR